VPHEIVGVALEANGGTLMSLLDRTTFAVISVLAGLEIAIVVLWRIAEARYARRGAAEAPWEAASRARLLRRHARGMAIAAGFPFLGPFIEWFIIPDYWAIASEPCPTFGQASLRTLLPLVLSISAWAEVFLSRDSAAALVMHTAADTM
jgi:hypothetical protein